MDLADTPQHVIKTVLDFDKRAKVAAAQAERLQADREARRETLNKRSFTLEDREMNHASFESACARYGAALTLAEKLSRAHERCADWVETLPPGSVLEPVDVDGLDFFDDLDAVKRRIKAAQAAIDQIRASPVVGDDVGERIEAWVRSRAVAPRLSGLERGRQLDVQFLQPVNPFDHRWERGPAYGPQADALGLACWLWPGHVAARLAEAIAKLGEMPMPVSQRASAIAELESEIEDLRFAAAGRLGDLDQPAEMLLGVRVSEIPAVRQRVA
jgi:hypothetical protein